MSYAWAAPYKNPFALIQPDPDNWQGLVGHDNGKLKFINNVYGARAGYINLINTYITKGLDTTSKIFPVYAPKGHGANDPQKYIEYVENISEIGPNDKIDSLESLYALGRAIARVERGSFLDSASLKEGFKLALQAVGHKLKNFTYDGGTLPEVVKKANKKDSSGGWQVVSLVGILIGAGLLMKFIK